MENKQTFTINVDGKEFTLNYSYQEFLHQMNWINNHGRNVNCPCDDCNVKSDNDEKFTITFNDNHFKSLNQFMKPMITEVLATGQKINCYQVPIITPEQSERIKESLRLPLSETGEPFINYINRLDNEKVFNPLNHEQSK